MIRLMAIVLAVLTLAQITGCSKNPAPSLKASLDENIFPTTGSNSTNESPTNNDSSTSDTSTNSKAQIDIQYLCSDEVAQSGIPKLRTATILSVAVYDASIMNMSVEFRQIVTPVYLVEDTIENKNGIIAGLINEKKLRLPNASLPDGDYVYMVCNNYDCTYSSQRGPGQFNLVPQRLYVKDGRWSTVRNGDAIPPFDIDQALFYSSVQEIYNTTEESTEDYPESEMPEIEKCDYSYSPLVIDFSGNGIELSAPLSGAKFDINGDGRLDQISWTQYADDRFLAMDRNGNGNIDNVNELFGDNTVGPDGKKAFDGFEALRKYDSNNDYLINKKDGAFSKLVVWSDINRDGKVQTGEMQSLASSGVTEVKLPRDVYYKLEVDKYFNETRRRSIVQFQNGQTTKVVDIWFRPI